MIAPANNAAFLAPEIVTVPPSCSPPLMMSLSKEIQSSLACCWNSAGVSVLIDNAWISLPTNPPRHL